MSDYKIISKVQVPDGSTYEIKPSGNANINIDGVYYVVATGTASALTGSISDLDSYYNGLKIVLFNGSGTNTNGSCTLAINSLASVPIKKAGSTNVGTIYSNAMALLCYKDGVFYHNNYYDSNSVEDTVNIMNLATDNAAMLKYSLCGLTQDYRISSFTDNSTQTTNGGKTPVKLFYRIGFPILYSTNTTVAANTTQASAYTLYENKKSVDMRYSMCNYNANRIAASGPTYFFMSVEVNTTNGTYIPFSQDTYISGTKDHIVCKSESINELIAGNFYIYLGVRSTSNKYVMDFEQDNDLYYYDGAHLIEYTLWLEEQNAHLAYGDTFGALTPIAGQDIYASEEYPAIVCLEYDYPYDAYNESEFEGHNLMYDITYIGSGRHINMDWGYAVLTHDIKTGERVDRKYLHKKWTYPLHTSLNDQHKQGFDIDSLLNQGRIDITHICGTEVHNQTLISNDRSDTIASLYRVIDSSIASFITDNTTFDVLKDKTDAPELYITLPCSHDTVNVNSNPPTISLEPGICYVAIPTPPFYDISTAGAPFYMNISRNFFTDSSIYLSSNWSPVFYNFGKVNFNTLNGSPVSISIDFSRNTFQAYDASGNQRSIPGYAFSSGTSLFDANGGGGGSTGSLYTIYAGLSSNKNASGNADTSVLSLSVPQTGLWKAEIQATLESYVDDHVGVDCFLVVANNDANKVEAGTIVSVPLKTSGQKPKHAGANVYLSALLNIENIQDDVKVVFYIRPSEYAVTVRAKHGASDTSTSLDGNGSATHIIMSRLGNSIPT